MTDKNIVVVGAGVSGLTTALLLSRNPRYKIVVAAKHMPGDYDSAEYASPWAGANYMPVSARGTKLADYDARTWPPLEKLAREHPESGVHFQECTIYTRAKDANSATAKWFDEMLSPNPWFKDIVPNYRNLSPSELPAGITAGKAFTSVCINTAIYLPYLVSECLRNNVVFCRAAINHILDPSSYSADNPTSSNPYIHPHVTSPSKNSNPKVDLIINCTGLNSCSLPGVEDSLVTPARGQIVLVRNTAPAMLNLSGTDDGDDEACYIMARAAGGGTVLGGCYQKGNWDTKVDEALVERIGRRCVEVCPELLEGMGREGLDVVRHGVGLRPVREGGARVEREEMRGVWVVHNYGHGGAGYQSSYGCSEEAVRLVDEVLGGGREAKL